MGVGTVLLGNDRLIAIDFASILNVSLSTAGGLWVAITTVNGWVGIQGVTYTEGSTNYTCSVQDLLRSCFFGQQRRY